MYDGVVTELFPEPSPNGPSLLEQRLQRLERLVVGVSRENDFLREQNRLLFARLYGRSSERFDDSKGDVQQLSLFSPVGATATPDNGARSGVTGTKVSSYSRGKGGRKPLPEGLPRIHKIHDIPDSEKMCGCGAHKTRIGAEVSEKLDIIPAQFQVLRHIRPKYACRRCEGVHDLPGRSTIAIAPPPVQLIPKAIASSGLLAHLVISKFADALPCYRQEGQLERLGVDIGRGTMCRWFIQVAEACKPLMEALRVEVRSGRVLNVDETTLQVLKELGRTAETLSYLWVFVGGAVGKPAVEFVYQPTRSGTVAAKYIGDFSGVVQTDAFSGYEFLGLMENVSHILCWAHVRRNFMDVVKAAGPTRAVGGVAHEALEKIRLLYAVEASARERELSPEKIRELRQAEAKPILQRLRAWLEQKKEAAPPRSLLGKAIRYPLNHWPELERYVDFGEVRIDNNRAENAIRPVAVGRKNWLFAETPKGARATATFFSLIETAKANRLEPYRYLCRLFEMLPLAKTPADFRALLPQHIDQTLLVPP